MLKSVYVKASKGDPPPAGNGDECQPQSLRVVNGNILYVSFRVWKPVKSALKPII